jgi:cytochrome c5
MSNAPTSHDQQHALADSGHDVHEGPIKTPKQLAWAVLASFLIPIFVIVLLVNYVDYADKPAAGSTGLTAEAIAARLAPVGRVEVRDFTDLAAARTGEQVYLAVCTACHAAGAAGAPKTGDTAAWAPRLAQGWDVLLTSVLKGKGAMGAQGGGDFSDYEIARAVVFLANKSGGKLPEPAAPVAAAASAPN